MSFKLHGIGEAFAALEQLCSMRYRVYDPVTGEVSYRFARRVFEKAVAEAEGEYARLLGHCGHQREELSKLSERIADGGPDDRRIDLPIGADGEPIRMGDTVRCGDGAPFEVTRLSYNRYGRWTVGDDVGSCCYDASLFLHAAPDTWEAIEAEARERLDDGLHPNDGWVLDLLYRVRGLYEGGE